MVGTTSIEKSEFLRELLNKEGIKHDVLNAREHEREAQIIADAGKLGAVTIATNMAGRGTDIQLGGNVEMKVLIFDADPSADQKPFVPESKLNTRMKGQVLEAGGLYVLATERHKAAASMANCVAVPVVRDPPFIFFLSLEDDLAYLRSGGWTVLSTLA